VLAATAGARFGARGDVIDVRGPVPGPVHVRVRTARVNDILGSALDDDAVVGYLEPIGFACARPGPGELDVTVPTFRPDTWREIDVIEEVARHHGYGALPRRRPSAPQVGGLTRYQRERRLARAVVAGFGAHEAWTPSLLAPDDHHRAGIEGGGVEVANPLAPDETVLRRSILPGMLKALAFNAARRQGELRLFEVGHVFPPPDAGRVERAFARTGETVIDEREMLAVAFAGRGDDGRTASAAWMALADALGVEHVELVQRADDAAGSAELGGLHPTRAGRLVESAPEATAGAATAHGAAGGRVIGAVGEVDPAVLDAFGLDSERQRVGWLEVDLELLLDGSHRRPETVTPFSRFPSSDVDLAFVVDDVVPAAELSKTLRAAGGDLLESLELFDVYRGPGLPPGTRSLAYRLRFCALDRTLTDAEVGELRARGIGAVERAHGASLRS
jgi:phenylalanyl-tRNA synthetase beta chain